MKDKIEQLEKLKKHVKTPEFKDVIDKKIDKLKNGAKIDKNGY